MDVPRAFAARRIAVSGEAGQQWIESLPSRIDELCRRWDLTITGEAMNGEVGLVMPVSQAGLALALKVSWPDHESKDEALALRVWDGNGAVRLIADDAAHGALLMERADNTRPLSAEPVEVAIDVAGRLLRQLAVPSPQGPPTLASEISRLSRSLPQDSDNLGWPVPRSVVDEAVLYLHDFDTEHANLLINADLHYDNILASAREPWLAIDPKLVTGDIEYGIAPLLWNLYRRIDLADAPGHFSALVDASGCDYELARRWTFVRLADYWLWAVETGLTNDPLMCAGLLAQLRA